MMNVFEMKFFGAYRLEKGYQWIDQLMNEHIKVYLVTIQYFLYDLQVLLIVCPFVVCCYVDIMNIILFLVSTSTENPNF